MSITLEIQSPAASRRRVVLRNGQVASFGREPWANYSFPADESMQPQHFELDCRSGRCVMSVLSDESDVIHNEMPVRSAELTAGDRLLAGNTQFQIQFTGLETSWSERATDTETPRFTETTGEACASVKLAPRVAEIVAAEPSPPECIAALKAAGEIEGAIRVLAAVLPSRAAVWWGLIGVRDTASEEFAVCTLVEQWVIDPAEERRREIEALILPMSKKRADVWLGWAVFFDGPSLAPPQVDAVPPAPELTGTSVATAFLLAAARNPLTMPATYERILSIGCEVLDGDRPWPEVAVDEE